MGKPKKAAFDCWACRKVSEFEVTGRVPFTSENPPVKKVKMSCEHCGAEHEVTMARADDMLGSPIWTTSRLG